LALHLAGLAGLVAQPAVNKSIVGTVSGFQPESAAIEIRPDSGAAVLVQCGLATTVQRVAPGEKDLKKAETIRVTDLAVGDRVLVTFLPGATEARRIVVMSATDIEKRREVERQDWIQRGVSGVVASVQGREITLRTRSFQGETRSTVIVNEKTVFRRYAPDSVRFVDAAASSLEVIRPGDQLRGRGEKSPDGLKLAAEEVVFGTFQTKAGSVTVVNVDAGEVTVKDLETNKPVLIKVTGDSQIKRMLDFPAPMGGPMGPGAMGPGGMRPAGNGSRPGAAADLAQMLERMPAATLADLKVGETIAVSSTRGASGRQITAIMLLVNAERLIQMATTQSRGSRPEGPGMSMEGMLGGAGGLELPGMIP